MSHHCVGPTTSVQKSTAAKEAVGDIAIRVHFHFARVLDLTNPKVVSAVTRRARLAEGWLNRIYAWKGGDPSDEARALRQWATSNGWEALKVYSTRVSDSANYVIFNAQQPVLEAVESIH